MEHETQKMLELIDRPAFLVRDGVVVYANQIAKQRLVTVGMTAKEIICQHYDAYENLKDGCLYLTLHIRDIPHEPNRYNSYNLLANRQQRHTQATTNHYMPNSNRL